ncbi:MAG: hypothetical protein K8R36_22155, partial [Planctomycetales bacterium]|nr:hypothetical protein [Planctomycetales bacterium]
MIVLFVTIMSVLSSVSSAALISIDINIDTTGDGFLVSSLMSGNAPSGGFAGTDPMNASENWNDFNGGTRLFHAITAGTTTGLLKQANNTPGGGPVTPVQWRLTNNGTTSTKYYMDSANYLPAVAPAALRQEV